jgi:putative protease
MVPLSVLGKLRHELAQRLDALAAQPPARRIATSPVLDQLRAELLRAEANGATSGEPSAAATLHVLCRSLAQLDSVLAAGVGDVLVDFADIRQYRPAVERARAAQARILLATPRIQKPDEMGLLRVLSRHGADGILVRNLAGLAFFAEHAVPCVADFSLNAGNELTVDWLCRAGAQRVTASYDLNREQLFDLVDATLASRLEVVIHQHMPMFHMEHCVFCAVLSPGSNKHNCGRPCDEHQVRLRDRVGMEHTLLADVGCRNTLFNSVPQSAAEAVGQLLARGVLHFRIELLNDEPADDVARRIDLYRRLLAGQLRGAQVWSELKAANRVGVTRGTLEERRNPLTIL